MAMMLLVCPVAAMSVDVLALYRNEIPPSYLKTDEGRAFVRSNIDALLSPRPDQVYYFITALERFSSLNDTADFRDNLRFCVSVRKASVYERGLWAASQRASISRLGLEPTQEIRGIEFFSPFARDSVLSAPVPVCPFPIDTNRLAFFSVLFMSHDPALHYNPDVNYDSIARGRYERMADGVLRAAENRCMDDCDPSAMRNLVEYWYVFSPSPPDGAVAPEAYTIIASLLRNQYSYGSAFNALSVACGFGINSTPTITYNVDHSPLYDPGPWKVESRQRQAFVDVSYRFQLRPEKSFLSYVRVGTRVLWGGASEGFVLPMARTSQFNRTILPGWTTTFYDTLISDGARLDIHSLTTIMIGGSAPIGYLTRNIAIEGGFVGGVNVIGYSARYSYSYKQVEVSTNTSDGRVDTQLVTSGERTVSDPDLKKQEFFFRPQASVVFEPAAWLNITALLSIDYVSLALGYSL